jgi:flagellar M-ring protein FliF
MTPKVKQIYSQLRDLSKKLSARSRVVIIASVVIAIALLGYLITADHTKYAPLFTGLSTEDASRITEELKKSKVPFKIEAGGTAVLVPEEVVHESRLSLAGKGLPRGGGVGFEIFDSQKFGISDFAQQVNYRRALQGELERTISQLDSVKASRVHIALPKRQLFARAQQPVSASVTLRLHSGRSLARASVKGIVHLVSSSVAGLNPAAVTVVNTSGEMLWSGKGGVTGANGPLDFKQNLEETLERRVTEIMNAALGTGNSVVKVTAEIGFAQVEETDTQYDPEKIAIRSESSLEEKDEKRGRKAAGIPGVRGNLPGGPGPQTAGTGSGSSRKRVTRNYEVNRSIRRKVLPAGQLKRLSVAVLVDANALQTQAAAAAGGAGAAKDKPVAKLNLAALEEVVRKAVGYAPERGDLVTLQAVPFAEDTLGAGDAAGGPVIQFLKEQSWVVPTAVVVVAVVVVLIWMRRRRKKVQEVEVIDLPKTVWELEGAAGAAAGLGPQGQAGAEPMAAGKTPLALGAGDVNARDLANAAAAHDAMRAASVLRSWIGEEA